MRTEAQKRARQKYEASHKGRRRTISIGTTAARAADELQAITAAGYTVSEFWHICAALLKAGKIPPKSEAQAIAAGSDADAPKE